MGCYSENDNVFPFCHLAINVLDTGQNDFCLLSCNWFLFSNIVLGLWWKQLDFLALMFKQTHVRTAINVNIIVKYLGSSKDNLTHIHSYHIVPYLVLINNKLYRDKAPLCNIKCSFIDPRYFIRMTVEFSFQTNLIYNHWGDIIDTTPTIYYHITISFSNLGQCVKNVSTSPDITNLRLYQGTPDYR